MINYTKRNVLVITLTITVLIYVVISVIWASICKTKEAHTVNNTQEKIVETQVTEEDIVDTQDIEKNIEAIKDKINTWKIKIPKINLSADISEGTGAKVIAKYVGHFARN